MLLPANNNETKLARGLLDVLIRAGLIAALVLYCYKVFQPFLGLMLWAVHELDRVDLGDGGDDY